MAEVFTISHIPAVLLVIFLTAMFGPIVAMWLIRHHSRCSCGRATWYIVTNLYPSNGSFSWEYKCDICVDKGGTMTEIQQTMITEVINLLISESYGTAKEKGWYDKPPSFGEQIALMHSELSEALEEYRNNEPNLYKMCDKPEGIGVELADVCIRIFDSCGHHGIDLAECIRLKMEYNKTRSHKHGGKRI